MYRGRLAPSPTGYLHLGHAVAFKLAAERASAADGELVVRIEDLDPQRSRQEYVDAFFDDIAWMGIETNGEVMIQSQRRAAHLAAWRHLLAEGHLYPCSRSRKDVREAAGAPHEDGGESIYPRAWRPPAGTGQDAEEPTGTNWRFRIPDGRTLTFEDAMAGPQAFVAGKHFGDFLVWRRDDVPAYELAVVVDDAAQEITEVVRGEDLLLSTARQLLLYEALALSPPAWCHLPLIRDASGRRLSKRDGDLGLKQLREAGLSFKDALARMSTGGEDRSRSP